MYWGGQSVRIILGAIMGPKFAHMANKLPASAKVETADLISFFVFAVVLGKAGSPHNLSLGILAYIRLAPLLWIRPEKLQLPFRVTSEQVLVPHKPLLMYCTRSPSSWSPQSCSEWCVHISTATVSPTNPNPAHLVPRNRQRRRRPHLHRNYHGWKQTKLEHGLRPAVLHWQLR